THCIDQRFVGPQRARTDRSCPKASRVLVHPRDRVSLPFLRCFTHRSHFLVSKSSGTPEGILVEPVKSLSKRVTQSRKFFTLLFLLRDGSDLRRSFVFSSRKSLSFSEHPRYLPNRRCATAR